MQTPPHWQDLRLTARALPELPGVYFWKDGRGRILYIGKAINLRARVTSYFHRAGKDRRTRDLLTRARNIQYEVTATELDALFRESSLIKQEQPVFNRALRRPRTMFFLKLDSAISDPYLEVSRGTEDDDSMYFGPFRSAAMARETLKFVHDVLPLRKCTRMKPRCRPCMYYQMRTCAAPALDDIHRERHQQAIAQLHDLLDGRGDRVLSWLERKRDLLSDSLMYERAAEMQERIEALREIVRRQIMLDAAVQCRCVLIRTESTREEPQLLLVAHGRVLFVRDALGVVPSQVTQWLRIHAPLIRAAAEDAAEADAASVLERWLVVNRDRIRWVAIPHDVAPADLLERISYVLDGAAVPV